MGVITNGPLGMQLVHGHPVVASFFHTVTAGSIPVEDADRESGTEEDDTAAENGEKRSLTIGDGSADAATSSDAGGSPASEKPSVKKRRRSRNQKPSYILRREEKEALEREVRELTARAKQLRDAAGITGVADALSAFSALSEAAGKAREHLAAARSVLSQHARGTQASPLHSFIRLPYDWAARRSLMQSLRGRKLKEARQFLAARTRHLSVSGASVSSFMDQSTWTTAGGDACGERLEMVPFRGVGSAQRVVDALLFYFIHLEISLSEQTGNTTVREDDEGSVQDPGVLHHRLQISMPRGEVVEKSSVLFVDQPERRPTSGPGELVFIAGDFVDEDERFPYSPRERVRKDISTLIRLAAVPDSDGGGGGDCGEEEGGPVVVMIKWQFLKLHAARELEGDGRRPLRTDELERLHANHMRGLDSMVATMRQFLYGAAAM